MSADPNSFDFYRRGEPGRVLNSGADPSSADFYRRGEPLLSPAVDAPVVADPLVPSSLHRRQQAAAQAWCSPYIPRQRKVMADQFGVTLVGTGTRSSGWLG